MGPDAPSLGEGGTAKTPRLGRRPRPCLPWTKVGRHHREPTSISAKYTNHAPSSIWPHGQEVDDIGPVLASPQPIPELRNVFPFKALVVPLEGHGQGREAPRDIYVGRMRRDPGLQVHGRSTPTKAAHLRVYPIASRSVSGRLSSRTSKVRLNCSCIPGTLPPTAGRVAGLGMAIASRSAWSRIRTRRRSSGDLGVRVRRRPRSRSSSPEKSVKGSRSGTARWRATYTCGRRCRYD
jgi:hypothetical protein